MDKRRCSDMDCFVLGFGTLVWTDNVLRWERAVSDDEDELERAKQAEQKQMSEIDKLMRELDKLKSERQTKKMDVDAFEEQIGKARREVGAIAKDIQAAQKLVNSIENKLEMRKGERHSILMHCKVHQRRYIGDNYHCILPQLSSLRSLVAETQTQRSCRTMRLCLGRRKKVGHPKQWIPVTDLEHINIEFLEKLI
ncbi:Structural maintenance of chromosomes protein 1B [Homalodisca vitripennis]|nr:Structural maintenance of chromosomes protein 1B [Homalodisca vitripennis]